MRVPVPARGSCPSADVNIVPRCSQPSRSLCPRADRCPWLILTSSHLAPISFQTLTILVPASESCPSADHNIVLSCSSLPSRSLRARADRASRLEFISSYITPICEVQIARHFRRPILRGCLWRFAWFGGQTRLRSEQILRMSQATQTPTWTL